MRGLTPHNLLEVCEWADSEHQANQALALLYAACPEISWEQLAALSIGQRDAMLLELREKTFGTEMQGYAECQYCGEQLEFAIATADVKVDQTVLADEHTLEFMGNSIRFRIPNSIDLLAISHHKDVGQASDALLQRCLIEASVDEERLDPAMLSDDVVAALADRISQTDPQAEVLLSLQCPACEQEGQVMFDISSFVWIEFVDLAKRLMNQVSWLARGYGWKESDILAMSGWRRRYYQDLLGV